MTQSGQDDLARFIEPVARALLGEPNTRLSTKRELRFGSNGSMVVDLKKGTAFTHEEERGGGVLWLIEHEKGLTGAEAFDFMREIGCDIPAPTRAASVPAPQQEAPARVVATYGYTDEYGELLFEVQRFEPKTFRQRRPDPSSPSGWNASVRGVRQVPYRLPELMEAIASDKTIVIVEGEKDVNNLAKWNIPATCNAGGAGKWPDEIVGFFAGADVLIVRDNDPQARNKKTGALLYWPADHALFPGKAIFPGQDHGELVAHKLHGIARRIRVLDLPNLPVKGDVSDWMEDGHTVEEFWRLADATTDWVKPAPKINSRFGGMRWEEIGAGSDADMQYPWLIEDIFPLGEISLVFGDSGTGKSFDQFAAAMCVALGQRFNGKNVEQGLVVYVAAEAGKGFGKRKRAYVEHHQLSSDLNVPFYLCTKRPDFFGSDDHVNALIDEIKCVANFYGVPLRAIWLDTLSALAPGMNENASQDVSLVRNRLVRLQETFPNVAIILVHHKPKNGSTPRGHGSLTADFETTVEYERMVEMRASNGLFVHRATVRKQREGKSGVAWQFTLPVYEVGKNRWGNRETSCVSVPYRHPYATTVGYRANGEQMEVIRAVIKCLHEHPRQPTAKVPRGVKAVVEQSQVRQAMMDARPSSGDLEKDLARVKGVLSRAGAKLRDAGIVGFLNGKPGLMWLTGEPVRGISTRVVDPEDQSDAA